jgi:hypothetical protein
MKFYDISFIHAYKQFGHGKMFLQEHPAIDQTAYMVA